MRKILLLGASGSIGTQSLDIIEKDKAAFELVSFSLGKRVEMIPSILARFPSVRRICVQREEDKAKLEKRFPNVVFYSGDEGLKSIIVDSREANMVVNALVGFSGLVPSITALECDKILCLANKESLVVGGELVNDLLRRDKGKLYPIDSEHVAIAKMLSRVDIDDVDTMLITASGGSFRNLSRSELANVTPEMALAHPTWSMGEKITIDCATMMNKGFEVIEAKVLFDFPLERTRILMHRESNVHSALLLKGGTYLADVSVPDMHGPIAYALYETNVEFSLAHVNRLEDIDPSFHFAAFDPSRYLAPGIALSAYDRGGNIPAVLNAANEIAVYAFLAGKISFLDIEDEISYAIENADYIANPNIEDLLETDRLTRERVGNRIERRRKQ